MGALPRSRITNSLFVRSTLPNPPAQPHLLRSGRRRHAPRLRDRLRNGRAQLELDHPEVGGWSSSARGASPHPQLGVGSLSRTRPSRWCRSGCRRRTAVITARKLQGKMKSIEPHRRRSLSQSTSPGIKQTKTVTGVVSCMPSSTTPLSCSTPQERRRAPCSELTVRASLRAIYRLEGRKRPRSRVQFTSGAMTSPPRRALQLGSTSSASSIPTCTTRNEA